MNRTLLEMVRSMLVDSKLPQRFWAEALSTPVYLRNRCPTRSVPNMTPYEALTGTKPKVGHLHVFGYTAYHHILKDERQKIDPKSQKCVVMGYSDQKKGYCLYDSRKERIVFSFDVTFNKDESSFEAKSDTTYVEIDLMNNDSCEEIVEDHPITEPEDKVEDPTPRRSTRQRNRPDYYGVYVNLVEIGNEPTTVSEALAGDDKKKWNNTMNCEYKSLISNEVLELVDPPKDCNIVKRNACSDTKSVRMAD